MKLQRNNYLLIAFIVLLSACTVDAAPSLTLETGDPTATTSPWESYACIPQSAQVETGTVVDVVDGDTIHVELEDGQVYRLRYIGMDTPERADPFFEQATGYNEDLVGGETVWLIKDVSETDRYGRLLRYVFVGEKFVNYELVRDGYAVAATFPPDVACADLFLEAETAAREEGVGLWSP